MDRICIEGLKAETVIGIHDWERNIRQTVRLDLEMHWDIAQAAANDAIADTLDYQKVTERLVAFINDAHFALIETLAERCAEIVLQEFGVNHLKLKLSKPLPSLGMECAAIVIERHR